MGETGSVGGGRRYGTSPQASSWSQRPALSLATCWASRVTLTSWAGASSARAPLSWQMRSWGLCGPPPPNRRGDGHLEHRGVSALFRRKKKKKKKKKNSSALIPLL